MTISILPKSPWVNEELTMFEDISKLNINEWVDQFLGLTN